MRPDLSGGAALEPLPYAALEGWVSERAGDAWPALQGSAIRIRDRARELRPAQPADQALQALAARLADWPASLPDDEARRAIEAAFQPWRIDLPNGRDGFLTGYYEPVVPGSRVRTDRFTAPILPRPTDLVTLQPDEAAEGLPPGFAAGRRTASGGLEPYPDRAAIEAASGGPDARPVVWLRDWVEVFLIQVQGSARVRLDDGSEMRLVYDGRNGHPYTSIGRLLIEAGAITPEAMSLDRLKDWLRQNGQANGEPGRALMQRNRSYIFFRAEPVQDGRAGPIGGEGLPLTPRRSIAVDRSVWSYGLPFWIETKDTIPGFGPEPLARLFVAQDTGSAILGAARADLFLGSGHEAGRQAGSVRHRARFTVLLPRST